MNGGFVSEAKPGENLFLEECVLELLLSEDLAALLATSDKVGHHLLSRSKR